MRRDDPLVSSVEFEVQANTDPAELETAAAKTRPVQTSARALGEECSALDQHLVPVWREDRDPVDAVTGSYDKGGEGVDVDQPYSVRSGHRLGEPVQRAASGDDVG